MMFGHSRGVSTLETLQQMLKDAGFDQVDVIPTRFKTMVFLRAC